MAEITEILKEFFSTDIRFHPIYLLPFLIIAFVLYRDAPDREGKSFWAWAFPKEIYTHPSHITDIKLFIFGRVLLLFTVFNKVFVRTLFIMIGMGITSLLTGISEQPQETTFLFLLLATLIMTVTADFCVYWVHRFHHETPIFWPFHAVHHSAEIMTPITVYRKHPIYDLISGFVKAVLVGFIMGVVLMLLIGQVEMTVVAGINIFYFIFNTLGSNFRHSHIWFSYGRFWEHIFISPAQHQVHHSLEPKHHNKNYGEILAIWDWLFGTLYIPEGREEISYGISKSSKSNERIDQPHVGLTTALIRPFQDSWKATKKRFKPSNKQSS